MKKNAFNKFISIFEKSDIVIISRIDEKNHTGTLEHNETYYYICNGVIILKLNKYLYESYFSGKKEYYFLLDNKRTVRSFKNSRKHNRPYEFIDFMDLQHWIDKDMKKSIHASITPYKRNISGKYAFDGTADIIKNKSGITLINTSFVSAFENAASGETFSLFSNPEKSETSPVIFECYYHNLKMFALPVRVATFPETVKKAIIEGV